MFINPLTLRYPGSKPTKNILYLFLYANFENDDCNLVLTKNSFFYITVTKY